MRTPKVVRDHQRLTRARSELVRCALQHADNFLAYQDYAADQLANGNADVAEKEGMRLAEASTQSREALLMASLRLREVTPRKRRRGRR